MNYYHEHKKQIIELDSLVTLLVNKENTIHEIRFFPRENVLNIISSGDKGKYGSTEAFNLCDLKSTGWEPTSSDDAESIRVHKLLFNDSAMARVIRIFAEISPLRVHAVKGAGVSIAVIHYDDLFYYCINIPMSGFDYPYKGSEDIKIDEPNVYVGVSR